LSITNSRSPPLAARRAALATSAVSGFSQKIGTRRASSSSSTVACVRVGVATITPATAGSSATSPTAPTAPAAMAASRAAGDGSPTTTALPSSSRSRRICRPQRPHPTSAT
jgi:hypothetical protein